MHRGHVLSNGGFFVLKLRYGHVSSNYRTVELHNLCGGYVRIDLRLDNL